MSLAVLASRTFCGLQALPVLVEVHVGSGLPSFSVVGLPDAGVRESRERVRSAIINSGYDFPAGRITANLAPADLPKESGRFDLPIALGVLLASGQVACGPGQRDGPDVQSYVFAGELSLTGAVVKVGAPLAIALAVARSQPGAVLILPADGAQMAAVVPGITVLAASCLAAVVAHFTGVAALPAVTAAPFVSAPSLSPCLSDVRGQAVARRVLEVAAAGGHSLLMTGPPGIGKSMLAQRLPGILPRLDSEQVLDVAALSSLSGRGDVLDDLPPFRAPHHSASMPALVGGGAYPRPGEISLAHHGVLFLDELPEFQRPVLEALREPLETGVVSIARALRSSQFPARFQLIAAMNPCPCGWLGHTRMQCVCRPDRVERYRGKVSGPFLDRIDLNITLAPVEMDWADAQPAESSKAVRQRVLQCRDRQQRRQQVLNANLGPSQMDGACPLDTAAKQVLKQGMLRWSWSARAAHRIIRVARTLADLQDSDMILPVHIAEAMRYRQPWPDLANALDKAQHIVV
ncbi:MAG: YifB family Mg chelatase-like AAA ATPase [Burkholderiaceae bacterium]|nr:YifB family Mg chelatase-like AAA ATPase [Burkholderiaceae bacterium]